MELRMLSNLFQFLLHEKQLLKELIELAERQQKALVEYKIEDLEEITTCQAELSKSLREAEERRLSMLAATLNVTRIDAANMTMTMLERYFDSDELHELRRLKHELRSLTNSLRNLNLVNRVLTNRARRSVSDILSMFRNGFNHVCNVKV